MSESQRDDEAAQGVGGIGQWLEAHPRIIAIGLAVVTVAIYGKCIGFGVLPTWDDPSYFIERPEVTDWWSVSWSLRILTPDLGYPVTIPTALYAMVRELPFESAVSVAHGLNLVFHLVNVVLVYALARRWLRGSGTAAVAALLWAVHPVLAESVCWITSLKFLTFATFGLGTLLVWSRHLESPSWSTGLGAVGLGILALGCRPEAIVLGPLLATVTWVERREVDWPSLLWRPIVALGVAAAVYFPVALSGQHENIYKDFDGNVYAVQEILIRVGSIMTIQISHLVQPFDLHPVYYYPNQAARVRDAWVGLVIFAGLVGVTAWAWRSNRRALKPLAVWWICYLPVSGLEYSPRGTADAYVYVASFGLIAGIVALVAPAVERLRPRLQRLIAGVTGVVAVGFALTAFVQADRWRDPISLWEPLRQVAPQEATPHRNVGEAYYNLEKYAKAVEVFREGYEPMMRDGGVTLAMPMALEELGKPDRALEVALDFLVHADEMRNDLEGYTLKLLARHDLPWPGEERARKELRGALGVVLEEETLSASERRKLADYLEEVGQRRLADRVEASNDKR
jgi:tetratricopeptide (TPR) repeat protein